MNLEGRTALVTGASRGLGPVVARSLHARGVTILASARNADPLESLCAELGERAEAVPADLSVREDVEMLGRRAQDVDILVANAGLPASGRVDEYSAVQLDHALDVNLRAPLELTRLLLPRMLERGEGHLVFMSSLLAKFARAGVSLYCATKFGLDGFTQSLRYDLDGTGVGVTAVFPGLVSDAGMSAESGVALPQRIGTVTGEEVAAAVIRGIEQNEAQVVVAPRKLRVMLGLTRLMPGLAVRANQRQDAREFAAAMSRAQADQR